MTKLQEKKCREKMLRIVGMRAHASGESVSSVSPLLPAWLSRAWKLGWKASARAASIAAKLAATTR